MKSKLCICIAELHYRKQFAYSYAAFRSISIAWMNTLRVITFSEKLAFPRGVALRITSLYAKMFQRLLRKAVQSATFCSFSLALRKAKAVTSATQGGTPCPFSLAKQKGSHYARPPYIERFKEPWLLLCSILNTH